MRIDVTGFGICKRKMSFSTLTHSEIFNLSLTSICRFHMFYSLLESGMRINKHLGFAVDSLFSDFIYIRNIFDFIVFIYSIS